MVLDSLTSRFLVLFSILVVNVGWSASLGGKCNLRSLIAGPNHTECDYDSIGDTFDLNCSVIFAQRKKQEDCDVHVRDSICKINILLNTDIAPSEFNVSYSRKPPLCLLYVNLTQIQSKVRHINFSNIKNIPIKWLSMIEPEGWTAVNQYLTKTVNLVALKVTGLHESFNDTPINIKDFRTLEDITFTDSTISAIMPYFLEVESSPNFKSLKLINVESKRIESSAIKFKECKDHEIEIIIENTKLPSKNSLRNDFISQNNCKGKPNSSLRLEMTGQSFEHSPPEELQQLIKTLAQKNKKFYVKLDEIDCCRRAEWVYDLVDNFGKNDSFKLDAQCFELLNQPQDYENSRSLQDACNKRDVYPILAISVISVLLLAILLATFSAICLFYIIPKRGSIVVINDPKAKAKSSGRLQYSVNSGKQAQSTEGPGILMLKTVNTDSTKDIPAVMLSETKAHRHAKGQPLNLPKVAIKLPAMRKDFLKRASSDMTRRKHPKPKQKAKAAEKKVYFGDRATLRSSELHLKGKSKGLSSILKPARTVTPKTIGTGSSSFTQATESIVLPQAPAKKPQEPEPTRDIQAPKTIDSDGKDLTTKSAKKVDDKLTKAAINPDSDDKLSKSAGLKSTSSFDAMSLALRTFK